MEEVVQVDMTYINGYFVIVFILAFYLVYKSKSSFKFELFFLSIYLMTGNINEFLTIRIPGISAFEIQPARFLFLLFSFFLMRYLLFSKNKMHLKTSWTTPWFILFLILYVFTEIFSQFTHAAHLGFGSVMLNSIHTINFLIIFYTLKLISGKETYRVIGNAIIIGALFSTFVSLIQIFVDPLFMRIGDFRTAFGDVLRANGIFTAENYNSFFLITAIAWVLVTVEKRQLKLGLVFLFTFGILLTFHRMSYLIIGLILTIYFLWIDRIAIHKLVMLGLAGICLLLTTFLIFRSEIVNSAVIQERLSEDAGGRVGYYTMVYENIGFYPIFGYGGRDNQVYYENMLKVTKVQDRATGFSGGIHSTYLSTMFYYGIPAFIFFTLFVLSSLTYFAKLTRHHLFFAIPLIITIFYAIGSLTNSYLFNRYIAIIFAIHLGIGVGAKQFEEYFPKQKKKLVKKLEKLESISL